MSEPLKGTSERTRSIKSGGVFISPKLKRTREFIDSNGNVIDPITKKVIQRNENNP